MSGPKFDAEKKMSAWSGWPGRARPHNGRVPGQGWRARRSFEQQPLVPDGRNQDLLSRLMGIDARSGHRDTMTKLERAVLHEVRGCVAAGALLADVTITVGQLMGLLGAKWVPLVDEHDSPVLGEDGEPKMCLGSHHGFGRWSVSRALRGLAEKGWIEIIYPWVKPKDSTGKGYQIHRIRFTVPARLADDWERVVGQSWAARGRHSKGTSTPKAPQNRGGVGGTDAPRPALPPIRPVGPVDPVSKLSADEVRTMLDGALKGARLPRREISRARDGP